jgi:hypothetical protein
MSQWLHTMLGGPLGSGFPASRPAAPTPIRRDQEQLDDSMARHPAGSRPHPDSEVNRVLDDCTTCAGQGAELCDDCAHIVLSAYRERRNQMR